jgi:hypothetical protein
MKLQSMFLIVVSLFLIACGARKENAPLDDLNSVKKEFLTAILSSEVDEGPFHINYTMKTVFFSKELISLFGEISVYQALPHGWRRYEGKTYAKIKGEFKEVSLWDLFQTTAQREFLRSYCENELQNNPISYFEGEAPYKSRLELADIHTFVVNEESLILIFQPYVAGSGEDGPFIVKIPFDHLKSGWNAENLLYITLQTVIASKEFISSASDRAF